MAVFSYKVPGFDEPHGYVNTDFVVHVEEIKRRHEEGRQAKVYLINGNVVMLYDEQALRLLAWYQARDIQREPARDEAEAAPPRRGGQRKGQEQELAGATS